MKLHTKMFVASFCLLSFGKMQAIDIPTKVAMIGGGARLMTLAATASKIIDEQLAVGLALLGGGIMVAADDELQKPSEKIKVLWLSGMLYAATTFVWKTAASLKFFNA